MTSHVINIMPLPYRTRAFVSTHVNTAVGSKCIEQRAQLVVLFCLRTRMMMWPLGQVPLWRGSGGGAMTPAFDPFGFITPRRLAAAFHI